MTGRLALAAALAAITAATFYFPGHTYLQSDTQIYVPMMERAVAGDAVLARDPMVAKPHTGFTVYDDAARVVRSLTGWGFERVLFAYQVLFRLLGVWGLWLISTGLGLGRTHAFFVTTVASLGAAIAGPSVLTIEYEPVPRGFALGALVLSLGLAMHRRIGWAGAAAACATLFHAPTAWPIWPALFCATFSRNWQPLREPGPDPIRDLARASEKPTKPLLSLAAFAVASCGLLLILSGGNAVQSMFRTIPPWLEQLQRMRAGYNWISEWKWQSVAHYVVVAAALFVAARAIRAPRWLLLPAAMGVLSVPVSWLLLDQLKWALMPQLQPARAVLWITLLSVICCAAAALEAQTWRQRALWLLPVFWIPARSVVIPDTFGIRETAVVLALAAGFAMRGKFTPLLAPLALWVIPVVAGVQNYRTGIDTPELRQVADWARTNTPSDSVFLFADARRGLAAGIFRARSLRALYVDWKSGGQINYFEDYARVWSDRWQSTGRCEGSVSAAKLAALGVDYAIFVESSTGGELAFRNQTYAVYKIKR